MIWLVNPGKPKRHAKKPYAARGRRAARAHGRISGTRVTKPSYGTHMSRAQMSAWDGVQYTAASAAAANKRRFKKGDSLRENPKRITFKSRGRKVSFKVNPIPGLPWQKSANAWKPKRAESRRVASFRGHMFGVPAAFKKTKAYKTAKRRVNRRRKTGKRIATFRKRRTPAQIAATKRMLAAARKRRVGKKSRKKSKRVVRRVNKKGARKAAHKERSMARKSKKRRGSKKRSHKRSHKRRSRRHSRRVPRGLSKARRAIKRGRSRKFGSKRSRSYIRKYKMRSNPMGGIMDSLKFAAPIIGAMVAGRFIATQAVSRVPGVSALGQHAAPALSLGMLVAAHYGVKRVGFLAKHSTAIMAGLGINFINTAIATYAPASIKGMIGVGDSGIYDQALAEYTQTSSYEETSGYEETGAYADLAGDRRALVGHSSASDAVDEWSPAESSEAGGIFANSGWGY